MSETFVKIIYIDQILERYTLYELHSVKKG